MAATINDIAKKVGVTKQTVSKIFNNRMTGVKISEETKKKVLKAKKTKGKKSRSERPILHTMDKIIKCNICFGNIKKDLKTMTCSCGKHYHESCAKRVGECPVCGTNLEDPMEMKN